MRIKESFKSEVGNRIYFENGIMLNNKKNKGEARVHYKLTKIRRRVIIKFWKTSVQMLP